MTKNSKQKKTKTKKKQLSTAAKGGIIGGLIVALGAAVALLLLGGAAVTENRIDRIIDYGTVAEGVSVNGINVSGMTKEQIVEATSGVENELLSKANFELDVDGEVHQMTAQELRLDSDIEDVIDKALLFGRTGSFIERKKQLEEAKSQGKGLEAKVCADESVVTSVVAEFKSNVDVEAASAGYEFMPWGYFEADGTKYEPDMDAMATANSKKQLYEHPEGLVRIAPEDMPNEIRYQYYIATRFYRDKYEEVYMPTNSDIARFKYTEESKGIKINAAETTKLIMEAVESGQFGKIQVPAEIIETNTSVEDAKRDTQLIASWSSYLNHDSRARMYNVAKLSGIICGVELKPGETWSINEEAGPRYLSNGWKEAAGYTNGVSVPQAGGGVCQISSTLYNAALRAGLDYNEDISSKRHSTVSDYIPIGLDATISTGGPDLKFTNPFDYPLYIVSYMNGKDKCVTVEVYGRPLTDDSGKEIIVDYTSKQTYKAETPTSRIVYDTAVTPAPTNWAVPVGEHKEVGHNQPLKKAKVYKIVYDLEGNVVEEKAYYYEATYPKKTQTIYCNFPQPVISGDPLVPDPPEPDPNDPNNPTDPTDPGETTDPGDGNNGNHNGQDDNDD